MSMTEICIKVGDLLDEVADVIVSTANPWLNMSGGVNGAILLRGGEAVQSELRKYLRDERKSAVEPGTVVVTGPGPLRARQILHAVAIDPFYDSGLELVGRTVECILNTAQRLGATSVAMPALATGYGHLTMDQFAEALATVLQADWPSIQRLTVVLWESENAQVVREHLQSRHIHVTE